MKVKVWNDNSYAYNETFREQKISIPAKEYIEMEHDEALLFRGTFAPIKRDADGNPTADGYKMIRIEEPGVPQPAAKVDPLLCQSCRYLALNPSDLTGHLKTHEADVLVDAEAEAEIERKSARKPRAS
jgi:hypothetical protein